MATRGMSEYLQTEYFLTTQKTGDDKGINCSEKFSVGVRGKTTGRIGIIGGGLPYPVEYAFHCDVADTVGSTITNATDVTSILQSDSGSTVTLFGNTTVGSYILVGSSSDNFPGLTVKINTAATAEPQNLIGQYYDGSWNNSTFMAFNDEGDYIKQYGWNICNEDNSVEQWSFGFNPLVLPTPWPKSTLNINGQDIEAYWGRFIIINNPISGNPIIEQLKIHTNHLRVSHNGKSTFFGETRRPISLISGLSNIIRNTAADPANESVTYATGVTRAYVDNEFANGAVDGFTFQQNIDVGIDTSVPFVVDVWYYVKGTNIGDIEFELDVINFKEGFVHDGSESKVSYQIIDTVSSPSNLIARRARFIVLVNYFQVNEKVVFNLYRDATAGNTDDTLIDNIVITDLDVTGYQYY